MSHAADNEIPRRIRLDRNVPAELAIRAAVDAVEQLPADVRLTEAVIMLGNAREWVADFIDGVQPSAAGGTDAPPPAPQAERSVEWALDNCYVLARRRINALKRDGQDVDALRVSESAAWGHVLRICEEAGLEQSGVLRRTFPTEITDGSDAPAAVPPALRALVAQMEEEAQERRMQADVYGAVREPANQKAMQSEHRLLVKWSQRWADALDAAFGPPVKEK